MNTFPLPIVFTEFADLSAQDCVRRETTWEELVVDLSEPKTHPSKTDCPLINFADFGKVRTKQQSLRHDQNVLQIYGVIGDYDAEKMSADEAAGLLRAANIEAFIYTSASHGVVGKKSFGGPRWRVLAPLSGPASRDQHCGLLARLNGALGGVLASESFTLSQSYYFGRVEGVAYETRRIHGELLDVLLDLPEIGKLAKVKKSDKLASAGTTGQGKPRSKRSLTFPEQVGPDTISHLKSALMEGLTASWADDRAKWVDVGMALKSLTSAGVSYEDARVLWHHFSARCVEKYEWEKADDAWITFAPTEITYKSIFFWAQDDGWVNPAAGCQGTDMRIDFTDVGNMNLLAKFTDGDLRYVPDIKLWLWWDGYRWTPDPHAVQAQQEALRVGDMYLDDVSVLKERLLESELSGADLKAMEKYIESVAAWARNCRSKRTIEAMLVLATRDARFVLPLDQLDTAPWLFGVANGVVDLRNGELRCAAREDYVTKRSPHAYDVTTVAPNWERFIGEITSLPDTATTFHARPALAGYLQRFCGYVMTGETKEHKMFVLVGDGSNGKSLLMDTIVEVMNDYAATIGSEALMTNRNDVDSERPTPGTRKLAGARLAVASESKDGACMDVAMIKKHTGDSFLTARGMRENSVTFRITHKLVLLTNIKPAIDSLDYAMRGRLHMIPFDVRWNRPGLPDPDQRLPMGDKHLGERLRAEGPAILSWLIQGAVTYYAEGLEPPKEVAGMTKEYFEEQDPINDWLAGFEVVPWEQGLRASDLHADLTEWCSTQGYEGRAAGSAKGLATKLKARGIRNDRTAKGKYYGLRKIAAAAGADS